MKERPVLMSGAMVRATLREEDPKTQTRRVVNGDVNGYEGLVVGTVAQERGHLGMHCFTRGDESVYQRCPYGEPGDRLWVRETWAGDDLCGTVYRADHPDADITAGDLDDGEQSLRRWVPSIHMPRWACRLVLEVTGVRVERLLEISVDDCFAEGIEPMRCPQCHLACYGLPGWGHDDVQKTPPEAYWHLWDQLNEARGYGRAKNPWVWVIEFKRGRDGRDQGIPAAVAGRVEANQPPHLG